MKKTILYHDELNDDFALTRDAIREKPVQDDFVYLHRSLLWRGAEWTAYRLVVTPLIALFCRVAFGLRIKNRSALRRAKSPVFLYANHTNGLIDAFFPTILSFPRKCRIITSDAAISIPCLKHFVQMLGAVPLPRSHRSGRNFIAAIREHIQSGDNVMIYPEAHLWPYYNDIRPFRDDSFSYPILTGYPVVAAAVVYRKRKLLRHLPPCATIVVSEPMCPDPALSLPEARRDLRDRVYWFLCSTVRGMESYEYIRYEKAPDDEKAAQ